MLPLTFYQNSEGAPERECNAASSNAPYMGRAGLRRRKARVREFNPCHSPSDGRFCSGEGGGPAIAMGRVKPGGGVPKELDPRALAAKVALNPQTPPAMEPPSETYRSGSEYYPRPGLPTRGYFGKEPVRGEEYYPRPSLPTQGYFGKEPVKPSRVPRLPVTVRKTTYRDKAGWSVRSRRGGAFGTKIFVQDEAQARQIAAAVKRGASSDEIDRLLRK